LESFVEKMLAEVGAQAFGGQDKRQGKGSERQMHEFMK
jgi:hypothetical protein